jgi:ribosomal protein S18 acetylase RimI-like enzyme
MTPPGSRPTTPQANAGIDDSEPADDAPETLSRDRIPIRSMTPEDLPAIIGIDRRMTGFDRSSYFKSKLAEMMGRSGVRVSLVAEIDDGVVGFIMARADLGEFGRTYPAAVIDTIGIHPAFANHGVGRALLSQLLANLSSLRVEVVRTEVRWDEFSLLGFLKHCGFKPSQHLSFTRQIGKAI